AQQHLYLVAIRKNNSIAEPLPLPINVDAAETSRFSPQRSRDLSSTVIFAQSLPHIDITTDNSSGIQKSNFEQDAHVQSYDCFGAISLNSVMQTNVPRPFGGSHKFSHLNMPGGQWSQEYKFTSQNMHNSHYTALRDDARADWAAYDQIASNILIKGKEIIKEDRLARRKFSTQRMKSPTSFDSSDAPKHDLAPGAFSKKEQLKRAFKEYGATIVAFHVGISLISLAGFYAVLSSGINVVPMLELLGITSSAVAEKVATGSTFVVAYAVHKVFAPARISITLGSTPFIVRYLRTKGFLKPKNQNV
ncbi:hypothetical protein KR018_011735, partial [Drosophila ironensis]